MTRIIAGAAGSLRLEVPKSGTRPTSDRVREAIFSALESWNLLEGSRVLDLYTGSGALGLEAASRGAAAAILVEKHAPAAQVASRNATTVRSAFAGTNTPEIEVVRASAQTFLEGIVDKLKRQSDRQLFDVIMLDPPYDVRETELTANLTQSALLLHPDGVVLVERSSRSPEPDWPDTLSLLRKKRYGETVLWWAERADSRDGETTNGAPAAR